MARAKREKDRKAVDADREDKRRRFVAWLNAMDKLADSEVYRMRFVNKK
jgi:hypothetical protein